MKTHLQKIRPVFSALAILSAALVQPLAFAQSPMEPDGASMPAERSIPPKQGGAMVMQGMDMQGMQGMMKDHNAKMESLKMTGNVDVDFALMMRSHHSGAIDMAQAELRDGRDPQMKKMAMAIIAAQKKEIAQFDKFLAKNKMPGEKAQK